MFTIQRRKRMPKYNVRMTEYYEFKNVEAANEEEAKRKKMYAC